MAEEREDYPGGSRARGSRMYSVNALGFTQLVSSFDVTLGQTDDNCRLGEPEGLRAIPCHHGWLLRLHPEELGARKMGNVERIHTATAVAEELREHAGRTVTTTTVLPRLCAFPDLTQIRVKGQVADPEKAWDVLQLTLSRDLTLTFLSCPASICLSS